MALTCGWGIGFCPIVSWNYWSFCCCVKNHITRRLVVIVHKLMKYRIYANTN